jgi:hypothetical protein
MATAAPIRKLAGLRWDAATRRYRRPNGRFLSEADTLRVLEAEIVAAKARFRAVGGNLTAGRISLAEFQIQVEGLSKRINLIGAAVEKGGFAQLSKSDLGWIGSRVRTSLGFVRNMAREIESGKQRLDGTLLARLDQYASEGRAAERAMSVRVARQDGSTHKRRVLGAADHCRTSTTRMGCIEAARKGYVPIDSQDVPEIGAATCLRSCRCRWAFKGGRAA